MIQLQSHKILIGSSRDTPSATKVLSIKLDSTITLPVVLKDVQPPKSATLKPLNEVITQISGGLTAGKFYKGENAPALITTLQVDGSCARIALQDDASEAEKHDLDRFRSRLQAGQLVSFLEYMLSRFSTHWLSVRDHDGNRDSGNVLLRKSRFMYEARNVTQTHWFGGQHSRYRGYDRA